jgi:predicted small integral membrane protein
MLSWMTWTWPTAIGFSLLALLLVGLTLADLRWPTRERKGLLPMPTTRGDRVFISIVALIGGTFLWLILAPGSSYLWVAVPVTLFTGANLKWG